MRLKKNIRVVLKIMLLIVLSIIIKDLFTIKTTIITNGKNYTCYGNKILQICNGKNFDI